jgi:hypothetical protein
MVGVVRKLSMLYRFLTVERTNSNYWRQKEPFRARRAPGRSRPQAPNQARTGPLHLKIWTTKPPQTHQSPDPDIEPNFILTIATLWCNKPNLIFFIIIILFMNITNKASLSLLLKHQHQRTSVASRVEISRIGTDLLDITQCMAIRMMGSSILSLDRASAPTLHVNEFLCNIIVILFCRR